ncbi:hypothetical protein D3C72_2501140 [compost metagenome]
MTAVLPGNQNMLHPIVSGRCPVFLYVGGEYDPSAGIGNIEALLSAVIQLPVEILQHIKPDID